MDMISLNKLLKSNNVDELLKEYVDGSERFKFLETLRTGALASYIGIRSVPEVVLKFKDAHSSAMQAQFELLDGSLLKTLKKEGRESAYLKYQRDDDPDLPDDPTTLSDPVIAYRYALSRLYRRQFEVTVNEQKDGCWPLLTCDLLDPIDGTRILLIQQLPTAVDLHHSPDFLDSMTLAQLRACKKTLDLLQFDISRRLGEHLQVSLDPKLPGDVQIMGKVEVAKKILKALWKWVEKIIVAREAAEIAKEAAELAARLANEAERRRQEKECKDAWNRLGGEPREIPGSSDHVDAFDRNHDAISRAC